MRASARRAFGHRDDHGTQALQSFRICGDDLVAAWSPLVVQAYSEAVALLGGQFSADKCPQSVHYGIFFDEVFSVCWEVQVSVPDVPCKVRQPRQTRQSNFYNQTGLVRITRARAALDGLTARGGPLPCDVLRPMDLSLSPQGVDQHWAQFTRA